MSIPIPSTPIAACVTGGPATGKTAWLVQRACELETEGVLVVCAMASRMFWRTITA